MRILSLFIVFLSLCSMALAADGFREFEFGDRIEEVRENGAKLCRFGEYQKDTRWLWRSKIDCTGYPFSKEVQARLFFFFSKDVLARIFVVSKDIDNYFLKRYPDHSYLVPLEPPSDKSRSMNLADKLLVRDKVHQLGNEYRYTTFFHNGKWEWEYMYERPGYQNSENALKEDQLEEEAEEGVTGWSKFNFGETAEQIKQKIEGMCSSIAVDLDIQRNEILTCRDFSFLNQRIPLAFYFLQNELVKIELQLEKDWYSRLRTELKKKYGLPYKELTENDLYFPYIEFPKAGIALVHKRDENDPENIFILLKYLREGYQDKDGVRKESERDDRKKQEQPESKGTIYDSI